MDELFESPRLVGFDPGDFFNPELLLFLQA